ncbi:hypothetical protein DSM3645_03278 [Blastopirellula marina DSM 3645]|uniref:Uncharacterized protein n=1 Tax=Blastopirellula marina DSM 3645 TaxID=314230 RepID=A3ZVW9_9BACT|nr:hypothetical protein DSM3645_03278 [Blastopirellula marina DSM 3645]
MRRCCNCRSARRFCWRCRPASNGA